MAREIEKFTYDFKFETTRRDPVRFLVGDVDPDRPLLDDREITNATTKFPNDYMAAAFLADGLAGQFSDKSDVKVGDVSKSLGQIADKFRQKAKDLRNEACKRTGVSFPAIDKAKKQAIRDNTSLVDPQFCIGLGDNPWASQLKEDLDGFGFRGW